MAQGAGQSIESAYELFNIIKNQTPDASNVYFKKRSERVKITKRRSDFNLFVFHFSSSAMQKIRNIFLKFLVKRKGFINSYLGTVYKNYFCFEDINFCLKLSISTADPFISQCQ